ncbi:MAG: hypothetical protein ABRQ38_07930 [Candidatus Eremiobacterota bacterium]
MGSLIVLALFIISVWAYIKIMRAREEKEDYTPVESNDDNAPDFSPYLAERLGIEQEEEEEEERSYDGIIEY